MNVDRFLLTFLSVDWNKFMSMGMLALYILYVYDIIIHIIVVLNWNLKQHFYRRYPLSYKRNTIRHPGWSAVINGIQSRCKMDTRWKHRVDDLWQNDNRRITFSMWNVSPGKPTCCSLYHICVKTIGYFSEGILLSGKTLDCRPRDCEFDPPHSN